MSQSSDVHQSLVPALACLRVTNGGVTPWESALPRVKTRCHVTPMLVEEKTRDKVPVSA